MTQRGKSTFRFVAIVITLTISVVAFAIAGFTRKAEKNTSATPLVERVVPVMAARAVPGRVEQKVEFVAEVFPYEEARISSRVTAGVVTVNCDAGMRVSAGDLLISLDTREIRDGIDAIESQIAQAASELEANRALVDSLVATATYLETEFRRNQSLGTKGSVAKSLVDAAAEKLNEARGKLSAARNKSKAMENLVKSLGSQKAQLETRLDFHSIRAPFDGIISAKFVTPGETAAPGRDLLALRDRSKLKLVFGVPQHDMKLVSQGREITYSVHGRDFKAKIDRMYPSRETSRVIMAESDIPDPTDFRLVCGTYVTVVLDAGTMDSPTTIPLGCVFEAPGRGTFVYSVTFSETIDATASGADKRANPGILKFMPIKVLASGKGMAAVEGIEPGTFAIRADFLGWTRLSQGQTVSVTFADETFR